MGSVRPGAGGCTEGEGISSNGEVRIWPPQEERWQDVPTTAKVNQSRQLDAQANRAAPSPNPEGRSEETQQLCLWQTFMFDTKGRSAQETLMSFGKEHSWLHGC